MANTLKDYNPTIFAQEALEQLEKALGMAFWVFRGFDKSPGQRGDVISIRRPGSFSTSSMPISTAADITAEQVQITLDQWEGVVFKLTDKELSATTELIVDEHMRPAAVAVADSIDQSLAALYKDIPHFVDASDPGAVTDFTEARRELFEQKVPNQPRAMMIDGEREADYLALEVFHSAEKSVDGGVAQRDGFLGNRFGFNIFANQNVQTHTPGTVISAGNDLAGAVNNAGGYAAGATSIDVDGFNLSETFKEGDIITFADHAGEDRYVIAADVTLSTGAGTLTISPGLRESVANDEVVNVRNQSKLVENLAFHRNAFALAMSPLSTLGNNAGARMGTAVDPITSLALRSRIWYEGKDAEVFVGLDALWGVQTLDEDMAVRLNS